MTWPETFGHMLTGMNTHHVVVVALDGVIPLDLSIPLHVFLPRPSTPYRLTVCGDADTVSTPIGFTIGSLTGLEALADADTIIVPGFDDHRRPPPPSVITALRFAARADIRIASICTGAFALAAAGLLDGRTVTTHWAMADDLEELYPLVQVNRNVLYVDDGDILTSAGITAGTDLCLHMVRKDLGAAVANDIARELVAAPHREGGQAQYISRTLPDSSATSLAETRQWALNHLGESLSIDELAVHASVSRRTLSRLWRDETGVSPHQWLLNARLNLAREMLETTTLSIEQIAVSTGLGSGTNFRLRFRDKVGVTPSAYRRTFSAA